MKLWMAMHATYVLPSMSKIYDICNLLSRSEWKNQDLDRSEIRHTQKYLSSIECRVLSPPHGRHSSVPQEHRSPTSCKYLPLF